jgi:hypothetical protein
MIEGAPSEASDRDGIAAPYDRFCRGVGRLSGYSLEEDGERVFLSFQPWFTESDKPWAEPCVRIEFRKRGDELVLERFIIEEDGDTRPVDIDAAHDALQAWLDYACA